jgi:hypothetical protein
MLQGVLELIELRIVKISLFRPRNGLTYTRLDLALLSNAKEEVDFKSSQP